MSRWTSGGDLAGRDGSDIQLYSLPFFYTITCTLFLKGRECQEKKEAEQELQQIPE